MLPPPEVKRAKNGCQGKLWFRSKRAAKAHARKWGQRVYQCRFGDHYHVTSRTHLRPPGIEGEGG